MSNSVTTFAVSGMTCEHCVNAVSGEIEKLRDVARVEIDLETSRATVTSNRPLASAEVAGAVTTAGYQLLEDWRAVSTAAMRAE